MQVFDQSFGALPDGTDVTLHTLRNSTGLQVSVMDYGATLVSALAADRDGNYDDVVLGFDNLEQYLSESLYFGSTVGRVANRVANAKFELEGVEYQLAANNGPNSLHGGEAGFDKKLWKAESFCDDLKAGVVFSYFSPDGEEGYPGNLEARVVYELNDQNELKIKMAGTADKSTPINMTNHAYFNLAGQGRGDVLGHQMQIFADNYTPVDESLIPTGEILPVAETPLDFNTPHSIGGRISFLENGYDYNYVLRKQQGEYCLAAIASDPETGRALEVWTDQPGLQFYTGNFIEKLTGKLGLRYDKQTGFCLEPQKFPDSVNQPNFESCILRPGQTYKHEMAYVFKLM